MRNPRVLERIKLLYQTGETENTKLQVYVAKEIITQQEANEIINPL